MSDDDLPPGIFLSGSSQPVAVPVLPRCWPDADSHETRGSSRGNAWICLAWAQGACVCGEECLGLHRLPSLVEEQRLTFSADGVEGDVFGRPRVRAIGAPRAALDSSTLSVGGLGGGLSQRDVRLALDRFGEWGQVVRTWCGVEPGTGHVRFRWRSSAQFAAEVLNGRSLDPEGGPPLRVSFATTDPELEQAQNARQMALRSVEEAKRRRDAQSELYERLEREARLGKVARTSRPDGCEGGSGDGVAGGAGGGGGPAVWEIQAGERLTAVTEVYPTADEPRVASYTGTSGAAGCVHTGDSVHTGGDGGSTAAEAPHHASAGAGDDSAESTGAGGHSTSGASEKGHAELPDGWVLGADPATGYMYYYHAPSARSQWERPC